MHLIEKLSNAFVASLLLCGLILLSAPSDAIAAGGIKIQLVAPPAPTSDQPNVPQPSTIKGFQLDLTKIYDLTRDPTNAALLTFKIEGRYENWANTLITSNRKINPSSDGTFSTVITIQNPTEIPDQEIHFKSISSFGAIEEADFRIIVLGEKRLRWNMGLQTTYSSFDDRAGIQVDQVALTLKGGATYFFNPSRWQAALSFYYNALPIIKPTGHEASQFWGFNTRLGYRFSTPLLGFTPTLSVGTYYWGMIVPGDEYGISSTYGPQFFLSGKKDYAEGSFLSLYLKYAPLSQGFSGYKVANRELAIGAATPVFRSWAAGGPLVMNVDISNLYVNVEEFNRTVAITTVSLGISKDF